MKVLAYPADEGGCGFYRIIAPCSTLIAQGHDVDFVASYDPPERQLQAKWWEDEHGTRRVIDVVAPDADVVILQRPLQSHLPGAIEILQSKGVKVIVEVDDDFDAISPRNVSWKAVQPKLSPGRNRQHLRRACELADLVTVSTPALARVYGRHGRVVVLPNFVPTARQWIKQDPHDGLFVGWSGSLDTHPDDLQVTRGGVARAINAVGATMAVVGTGKGVKAALALRDVPLACGWRSLQDYPEALAQFDVGIVPLDLTPFNQAKSCLKMMEMASVGVACVGSPTDDNLRIHAEGVGLIASKPSEWEGIVKRLLRDDGYRFEVAAQGREAMKAHTYEANAWRWIEAWESVVNSPCHV